MWKNFLQWIGLAPTKWQELYRILLLAGHDSIEHALIGQSVGEVGGEQVILSLFHDSSSGSPVPRNFVDHFARIKIEVGGVDLSCVAGPHLDLALDWAKKQAQTKRQNHATEQAKMLAKIS